jgi:hypothetical protein
MDKTNRIKVWCYWEHLDEHIGNMREPFGNLMRTPWELIEGNTLGTEKKKPHPRHPTIPLPKRKKNLDLFGFP